MAEFSKGKGISKSEITEDGITECVRYGELYTHYNEVIDEVKSRTNVDARDLVFSEANDVIIPSSGETQLDIATASCVIKAGIALGGDLNIIRTSANGIFLSYYLNSKKKKDIARLAQGISVVHLYSSQLAALCISFPSLNEQNKIASFLALIDKRIATQNKIIKGIKLLKSKLSKSILRQQLRFKDGSMQFPKWNNKKLGEICEIIGGGTPQTGNDVYWNGNIQWFTPTEIKSNSVHKSERTITQLGLKNSSAKILPKGPSYLQRELQLEKQQLLKWNAPQIKDFSHLLPKRT
jgi:type I restriction enzyme S subunit